jgi:hypothetical protein
MNILGTKINLYMENSVLQQHHSNLKYSFRYQHHNFVSNTNFIWLWSMTWEDGLVSSPWGLLRSFIFITVNSYGTHLST